MSETCEQDGTQTQNNSRTNFALIAGVYDETPVESTEQLRLNQYVGSMEEIKMTSLNEEEEGGNAVHLKVDVSDGSMPEKDHPITENSDEVGKEISFVLTEDAAEQLAADVFSLIDCDPLEYL